MQIIVTLPDSFEQIMTRTERIDYETYLQYMANRIYVGALRYGPPSKRKRYLKRIKLELRAYGIDGNFEHLLNIANYTWLESKAPENRKFHFNPNAASATREILGGQIA